MLAQSANDSSPVTARARSWKKLAGEFKFTEGPTCDQDGNVFFTDQPNNRIMKWSVDGKALDVPATGGPGERDVFRRPRPI